MSTSTEKRGSFSNNLFHSIKKLAKNTTSSGALQTEDGDFEQLKNQFAALHQILTNTRTHLSSYTQGLKSVLLASQALTGDFADALQDVQKPNPFLNQLQDAKVAHSSLINSDKQSERYLNSLIEDSLSRRINEELSEHALIYKKIEDRGKLRSDYLYYKQKMDELQNEKTSRSAKGKSESVKDIEKFDRNQDKLKEAQTAYEKLNQEVMSDMNTKISARGNNFGPCLRDFINVEKQFANIYYNAVKNIADVEYAAGADLQQGFGGPTVSPYEQE